MINMNRRDSILGSVYTRDSLFSGIDELTLTLFESLLEASVIFDRIERLPLELIDRVIEASLFSEPLGSHDALHSLQAFCKENKKSSLTSMIHAVLESRSFRTRVETTWRLCPDFDHTKTCRHSFHKNASHDLASKTIVNCAQCFEFLLARQTIRASSFCQTGQSFYLIAVKSENPDVIKRLMSSMELQDVFKPASVNGTSSECKSILQFTTCNAQWFQGCWERLRSLPEVNLSTLGPSEIRNLCHFADVDLANELFLRGVDLGIPSPDNGLPNWDALVHLRTPEPMLWWFWSRGLVPPEGLLTHAATYNCVDAARWILRHSQSYEDWRRAALVAAGKSEPESGECFEMIVQHPPAEHRKDRTFSQNLLIKIVDKACDKSRSCDSYLSETRFSGWTIDIHRLRREKECMEEISVRKIQAIRGLNDHAGVTGIKVQARQAGLEEIAEALEAFL